MDGFSSLGLDWSLCNKCVYANGPTMLPPEISSPFMGSISDSSIRPESRPRSIIREWRALTLLVIRGVIEVEHPPLVNY